MFITITALLCTAAHLCVEEVITDSTMDNTLSMQSCMHGQAAAADWMSKHPIYHTGYTLEKLGCTIGNRKPLNNKHDKA